MDLTVISQGINQNQRETALRMLKRGKMTVEEIAEDTGLSAAEVGQIAGTFGQCKMEKRLLQ